MLAIKLGRRSHFSHYMAKNPVIVICLHSIRNRNLRQSLIVESLPEVEDAVGDAEEDEGEGEVLQVRARLLQEDIREELFNHFLTKQFLRIPEAQIST
jgi:hypothetical protein